MNSKLEVTQRKGLAVAAVGRWPSVFGFYKLRVRTVPAFKRRCRSLSDGTLTLAGVVWRHDVASAVRAICSGFRMSSRRGLPEAVTIRPGRGSALYSINQSGTVSSRYW